MKKMITKEEKLFRIERLIKFNLEEKERLQRDNYMYGHVQINYIDEANRQLEILKKDVENNTDNSTYTFAYDDDFVVLKSTLKKE